MFSIASEPSPRHSTVDPLLIHNRKLITPNATSNTVDIGVVTKLANEVDGMLKEVPYIKAITEVVLQIIAIKDEIFKGEARALFQKVLSKSKDVLEGLLRIANASNKDSLPPMEKKLTNYYKLLVDVKDVLKRPLSTGPFHRLLSRILGKNDLDWYKRRLNDFGTHFMLDETIQLKVKPKRDSTDASALWHKAIMEEIHVRRTEKVTEIVNKSPNTSSTLDTDTAPAAHYNSPELPPPDVLTEFITPVLADAHIARCQPKIHQTLHDGGFDGMFSLHSGFNPATIHLKDPEQEVYIILDSEISDDLREALVAMIMPFPSIVVTPDDFNDLDDGGYGTELHDLPPSEERFRYTDPGQNDSTGGDDTNNMSSRSPGSEHQDDKQNNYNNSPNPNQIDGKSGDGGGGDNGGVEKNGGLGREGNGTGKNNASDNDGDGNEDADQKDDAADIQDPGSNNDGLKRGCVSIPFSSHLASKDNKEKFGMSSLLRTSVSEKGGSVWPGPSLEVDMAMLHVSSQSPGQSFKLGLCQVHVVASSCRLNVVNWSPHVVHAEDASVHREETNVTGTASVTLSMNPSVYFDGKVGSTKGTERTQQPWTIESHKYGLAATAPDSKGVFWKYIHNAQGGRPVQGETFEPRPKILFGLDDSPYIALPILEVQVVLLWSFNKQFLRAWRPKSKGDNNSLQLPANLDLIHRATLSIDLRALSEKDVLVMDGDVEDKIPIFPPTGGSTTFSPHRLGLSTGSKPSKVDIFISRAVEGRIKGISSVTTSEFDFLNPPSNVTLSTEYPTPQTTAPPSVDIPL